MTGTVLDRLPTLLTIDSGSGHSCTAGPGRHFRLVLRSLSGLGDYVLTTELEAALTDMRDALSAAGRQGSAEAVAAALDGLGRSIGRLNSRSTRAEAAGERVRPGSPA